MDLTTRKQEKIVRENEKLHIQPKCCVNLGQGDDKRKLNYPSNIKVKI